MLLEKVKLRWVILGFLFVFLSWNIIVILSGYGFNLFDVSWNFKTLGEFGDSFGFLNSISSIIAAFFTYLVLRITIQENEKLRAEVNKRDMEESRRKHAERFFNLLDLRLRILENLKISSHHINGRRDNGLLDISIGSQDFSGIQAIKYIMTDINVGHYVGFNYYGSHSEEKDQKYSRRDCEQILFWHRDDLSHYLRFTYHIIKYIDDNISDQREAYGYLRILRAQWAEAEQSLIALNSIFGSGVDKFQPLLNKYALLHGMSLSVRGNFNLDNLFKKGAFDFNPTES